jgi:3-deoxy-manno-octulosonate cytidylyltransferase (CMP-KDO synthetase)
MIEHVYRRAAEARGVDAVVVATDDDRIAAAVRSFGGVVRITAGEHQTGTDRIAELVRDLPCTIVVNVQGDLPLLNPDMIDQVVAPLKADPTARMSTVYRRATTMADYLSPHVVKVVVDRTGHALYFSRAPVPFGSTALLNTLSPTPVFKHIGMYAYRRDFLLAFAALPRTALEQAESLEQLRALEHGFRIRAVEIDYESIEVDTPEDLERARRLIAGYAPATQTG